MKESIESRKVWCRVMIYYFYDRNGQFISLTFQREHFRSDAKHVLIWAFTDERKKEIVLTRHGRRGWEVPGGKVEPDETTEEAAHRELFEETGVKTHDMYWMGQYVIDAGEGRDPVVKNIYTGIVQEWSDIPSGFETVERAAFPLSLMPFQSDMSPFIQDNIFPLCRAHVST